MNFRVALAQLSPVLFDKAANLEKAGRYIAQAARDGAQVVIFPELFLTGYSLGQQAVEMAESLNGDSITQVVSLARQHQVAVLIGFAELAASGNVAYDSIALVSQSGEMLASYRKAHLYQHEKEWFTAGAQALAVPSDFGRIGLMVCYDVEFPELARALALRGADWLAAPTAIMRPYEHIQQIATQARALENRRWLVSVNRVGQEGELDFFGGSLVCDPYGQVITRASEAEILLIAEIDLALNERARQAGDYLADRRPELY